MSKSPSLRRIQADVRELALDPSDRYHAAPLENDMFEWHFTIRGAEGTDFEGGIYHGRILLPAEYPFKPPHIVFLTPSGRFETNTKVCLSFSAFHPELWQPAWGIRLILEALISFLPTPADGAIGALDWSSEERKRLAKLSQNFVCHTCGKCCDLLPELKEKKASGTTRFAKEIAELQRLQQEAEKKSPDGKDANAEKKEEGTAASTSVESINLEAPEEEIVFGAATPTAAGKDGDEDETGGAASLTATPKNDEDDNDNNNTAAAVNHPAADNDNSLDNEILNNNDFMAAEAAEANDDYDDDDPSWMYDPLLNLMMVLLAAICYLLVQKFQELMEELRQLQQLQGADST